MRTSRLYVANPLQPGPQELPPETAHYAGRVLRLGPGDILHLFDGSGMEYPTCVLEAQKKRVYVEVGEPQPGMSPSPLQTHLGQCLSRGERMDWVIQKATELGVTEITPLFSERSEIRLDESRQEKRLVHWRQIAISACEQCGRSRLPIIHPASPLKQWQEHTQADLKLTLHPVAVPLGGHPAPGRLTLLVGPEGGLSDEEIQSSLDNGFQTLGLGPRVLRTETAPLAALSLVQYLWGDLGSASS